ncbi:MAG TPA: DNA polymerase/3'-5' exonuclease PolX [Roseiflexaceae bacterium]|nr:DNA polymerase/3'-5' exonuclease PolX [Roseiflexaceae bacterium]
MASLTNREIADVFYAIADTLEILGEDRYRIQAYRRGGDAVVDLPSPLAAYRNRGELEAIAGIGKAIADKIGELLDTGELQFYLKLKARVPPGVRELLRVPHLGAKKAGRLYSELGIASLADLKAAAESGRLNTIKGFSAKTTAGILEGIAQVEQRDLRTLLFNALHTAESLIDALRQVRPDLQIAYAGSLRRGRATIGDLDLLAAGPDPAAIIRAFTTLPVVARVDAAGDQKATILLQNGQQTDLIAVEPANWGSALLHFSGSRAHNIRFRELALARGLSFSEHGFRRDDGSMLRCATEEDAYAVLDLPWIPPELREDNGEFEAARAGRLPQLVTQQALGADLHMHSNWSDGRASIRDMASRARQLGYHTIAMTDHSAYVPITNGLDAQRLRAQAAEIAALNAEYAAAGDRFRILHGIEVDILPDGELALPDEILAALDIVVASPHVSLRQPAEQATERLLRAIRNPHVDIIGHPTGRLIGQREGLPIDIDAIATAAAETDTLLEVNSGPDRLDLDSSLARRALELGARLSINSDAHHPDNLAWIRLGVITARRGWADAALVANTWDADQLRGWLQR